jgi:hypothetical protein
VSVHGGSSRLESAPVGFGSPFGRNITLTGGPAPARAYIETLLPDVLNGTVNPGKVFDREIGLDDTPRDTRQWITAKHSRSSSGRSAARPAARAG